MKITTIGIDLAKVVFKIHGVDERGKVGVRKQLKRAEMTNYFSNLEALLREKQAEVFEFVDFLSERCGASADKPLKRAEAAAKTWNSFNERNGSFADQHTTL
jgi:hypothetical protein